MHYKTQQIVALNPHVLYFEQMKKLQPQLRVKPKKKLNSKLRVGPLKK